MTREEAVALLERYSNYDGMGIQNLAGCKEAMKVAVDALKEASPELAESEDERIRKRLIEYFEGFRMGNAEVKWEGLTVQEVLAWLDGRNIEQKPVDFPTTDEEVNEFLKTHSKVEVPEKYKTPEFVFSKQEYESYPIISKDTTSVKPAEWSEENYDKISKQVYEAIRRVLASLAVYAENEALLDSKEEILSYYSQQCAEKILKSLRPVSKESLQPHWKPSKEQMEALERAIIFLEKQGHFVEVDILKSIQRNLKKL